MADKGIPFDVPTRANLLLGQQLIDEQLREKAARDAKLSPLDKAQAALEAARTFGSGILATVGSLPTRAIKGKDAAQEYINQRMYIPTTEKGMDYVGNVGDFLEQLETKYKLPPVLPEAAALQQVAGPAAKQATKQAVKAAKPVVGQTLEDYMFKQGLAMPVVKPKGGNWLSGNVEKQVGRMKMADTIPTEKLAENQQAIDTAKRIMGDDPTAQRAIQQMEHEMAVNKRNNAINNWIDRNLTNYIKKEMGTPEDPVRKLAEEGILHIKPVGDQYEVSQRLMHKRKGAGFNPLGEGKSEPARFWERQADISIDPYPAGSYKHGALDEGLLEANPWLKNVPDEEIISYGKGLNDLGFDHIVDVLKQDLAEGRIRPEQLNKVSIEQAVRRTYEYDQEMAKRMREAQIKATEGMPVHKEYPEGYKWIELAPSKELPEGWTTKNGAYYDPKGERHVHPDSEKLANALKYEGDTMGHCVGGYCPDVMEGRSRIFSLRDARGEPHVTVEVQPHNPNLEFMYAKQNLPDLYAKYSANRSNYFNSWPEFLKKEAPELLNATENKIVQIKGKQNAAPKEEYLPFVQDFVRSGQWSDVGDLRNTGLIKNNGKYMTKSEYDDYLLNQLQPPPVEGMKRGGPVHIADNPDTMMMEVEDQKFGIGGMAGKAVKSAIATRELEKQAVLRAEAAAKSAAKQALMPQYNEAVKGMTKKQDPLSFEEWKAINYPEPEMAAGGAVFNTDPDMSDGGQIIEGAPFKNGGDVSLDAMYMAVNDAKFRRK